MNPTEETVDGADNTFDVLLRAVAAAPAVPIKSPRLPDLEPGTVIADTFRVEDVVGRGGTATVYRARDLQLDRSVALKLHNAQDEEVHSSRDWRGAKAMARLSHPNVIVVHEVGVFEGRMFIAMEYADGGTARDWATRQTRHWTEILDLYRQAATGLLAAHHVGLVHRDFKPDNVLVDEDGRARVADFGLARAPGSAATDTLRAQTAAEGQDSLPDEDAPSSGSSNGSLTAVGTVCGTPAYMAPEQHHGRSVDAPADQFSLCVSIFEALYGELPFAGATHSEIWDSRDAGKVILPASASVPKFVHTALCRGLSVKPEDRFPDVQALLDALDHRAWRRRRRWTTFVGVSAPLVAGALGLAALREGDCAQADRAPTMAWDATSQERTRLAFEATGLAYATTAFERVAPQLHSYAEMWGSAAHEACLATHDLGQQSELLFDRRMACLAHRWAEFDSTVQLLQQADRGVVEHATELTDALRPLDRCADRDFLLASVVPPEAAAAEVESIRHAIADAAVVRLAGRGKQAPRAAAAAVVQAEAVDYPPVLAEALLEQGRALLFTQDPAGEDALRRAHTLGVEYRHDEVAAQSAAVLARTIGVTPVRLNEATTWYQIATAGSRRVDASKVQLATLETNHGNALYIAAKYDQALVLYERALQRMGTSQRTARVRTLSGLGNVHDAQQNFERAGEFHESALELAEAILGPEHPVVANMLANSATNYGKLGRVHDELAARERALAIDLAAFGHNSPALVDRYLGIGGFYRRRGQQAKSLEYNLLALGVSRESEHQPQLSFVLENLASNYMAVGRFDEALPHYREALALHRASHGDSHAGVGAIRTNLGNALQRLDQFEAAAVEYGLAMEIFKETFPPHHSAAGIVLLNRTSAQYQAENHAGALVTLSAALDIFDANTTEGRLGIARAATLRGEILDDLGDLDAAIAARTEALALYTELDFTYPHEAQMAFRDLGWNLLDAGETDSAADVFDRGLALAERVDVQPKHRAAIEFGRAVAYQLANDERQAEHFARLSWQRYAAEDELDDAFVPRLKEWAHKHGYTLATDPE
ncbi:MAG: serine/threonine protein kinase [Nannocystaceae bacterium]|nr:serine/threonine protein kinase [Nannocystaceae bacterium]